MTNWKEKITSWMERAEPVATKWLSQLVQCDSTTGREKEAQRITRDILVEMGAKVDMWEPEGDTLINHPLFNATRTDFTDSPNVVGVFKGTGGGRSMILNGHIDVVPEGDREQWESDPWSGTVKKGKLYGRGSTDMKGGNVAALLAVKCLTDLRVRLKGDVIFESVIEEESGGSGSLAAALRGYRADAAIIPEPTDMKIFPKTQGSMWFRLYVPGLSAHGGTRYEGVSAIDKAFLVVQAIRQLEEERNAEIQDPLYAQTPIPVPINIGKIQGGSWPSAVADEVVLEGRMGVKPEEDLVAARESLERAIRKLCQQDEWLEKHPVKVEWFGARWVSSNLSSEHPLIRSLSEQYQTVMGREPEIEASPWATDAGMLQTAAKTPTVVFGPGVTAVAHYPNEYIPLRRILDCAKVIALTLIDWCGIDDC